MDKIQWTREVPLLTNYYMIMDVFFAVLAGSGGLGVILFLIMGVDQFFTVLRIMTLTTGVLIVLAFLAMGVFMMNNVKMTFTLDEKGISTRMSKRESRINQVSLLLGFLARKPGLMGSSLMAMSRESTFVEWKDIEKVVMDDRKKVISLSSGRKLIVRLYCTPETYPKSVETVERILFESELKHI